MLGRSPSWGEFLSNHWVHRTGNVQRSIFDQRLDQGMKSVSCSTKWRRFISDLLAEQELYSYICPLIEQEYHLVVNVVHLWITIADSCIDDYCVEYWLRYQSLFVTMIFSWSALTAFSCHFMFDSYPLENLLLLYFSWEKFCCSFLIKKNLVMVFTIKIYQEAKRLVAKE